MFSRGVSRSRSGSVMLLWWYMMVYVVFVTRVPQLVRRSRFLLRLYKVGPAI